jgi:hypothetical protein
MSYTPRIDEHGRECCTRITEDGRKAYGIRTASGALAVCDACREHHAATLRTNTYAPPDAYARPLAELRFAAAPLSTFERDYRAARRRDVMATRATLNESNESPFATRTAAELSAYAPPDSYAAGLKALRTRERR